MNDRVDELASRIVDRLPTARRHLVGIAGPVAVGKSTIAAALIDALDASGLRAHAVATDCFLYPNALLSERGLLWRKGFPETYDVDALLACVTQVRQGDSDVTVPVYSHRSYDIVPDDTARLPPVDVLVIEGVTALQEPLRSQVDVGVYVDAAEDDVVEWFVGRFLQLRAESAHDSESFYGAFAGMNDDEVRSLAMDAWTHINGPNLHQHIEPSRRHADLVVAKSRDHSIVSIMPPTSDAP